MSMTKQTEQFVLNFNFISRDTVAIKCLTRILSLSTMARLLGVSLY